MENIVFQKFFQSFNENLEFISQLIVSYIYRIQGLCLNFANYNIQLSLLTKMGIPLFAFSIVHNYLIE